MHKDTVTWSLKTKDFVQFWLRI